MRIVSAPARPLVSSFLVRGSGRPSVGGRSAHKTKTSDTSFVVRLRALRFAFDERCRAAMIRLGAPRDDPAGRFDESSLETLITAAPGHAPKSPARALGRRREPWPSIFGIRAGFSVSYLIIVSYKQSKCRSRAIFGPRSAPDVRA